MKLVIVESPAKAKTIQKYLGHGYVVKSSYGHIRDLPKTKLGVDTANGFVPHYIIPPKARQQVKELLRAAKGADEIYFATDEDREGEAIAWHLVHVLKTPATKVRRITFAEITKTAIQKALANPRDIDQHLVNAQQARRILDRLVGYELSPLLWKKIRRGLSAGRVQSVAVRLIAEREEAIAAFTTKEYWSLTANLNKDATTFGAALNKLHGTKLKKLGIKDKKSVDRIITELNDAQYTVVNAEAQDRTRTPPPPFTTSTFQQAAVNALGMSSKQAMMVAQQLYESGFISYMRTDSLNVSAESASTAARVIAQRFGSDYALESPRFYKNKSKGAQEAHEAIRPTDPARTPDDLAGELEGTQRNVYRLIWQRFIASQMAAARLQQVTVDISAGPHEFRATGTTVIFPGYVKALGTKTAFKETVLPALAGGDTVALESLVPEQHFTQPPARYSEASLVKALEEHGIGRPSTYAPTIDTIQRREYVVKNADKRFAPTEIGTLVTNLLKDHFPTIVDLAFTADMEADLDRIAEGVKEWQPILSSFYDPFHKNIKQKEKELSKKELTQEKTGETCPECGHELVIKLGRFGKFKACSNYPDCKYTEPVGEEKKMQAEATDKICPECGKPVVVRHGRFGPFFGCSGYPTCKYIEKMERKTGATCPKCGKGEIIEKRSKHGKTFYACNQYPDCKNAYWSKPTGEKCPRCESLLLYGAKNTVRCSNKECGFKKIERNN